MELDGTSWNASHALGCVASVPRLACLRPADVLGPRNLEDHCPAHYSGGRSQFELNFSDNRFGSARFLPAPFLLHCKLKYPKFGMAGTRDQMGRW